MKYRISTIVAGSPGFIEIDEAKYQHISMARKNLFEALFLEEKLDFVMENYYEYEIELISIASRLMIFSDLDYFSMSRDRNVVSRRIANLMSACRMYLDQIVHHLKNIYGKNSDLLKEVKNEISEKYDHNLGYRVMEALRNYVQHRGSPIHSVKFSHETVGEEGDTELLHTITPYIKVSAIEEDKKFKKTVLEELIDIQLDDQVDIKPIIREYIECIGNIHEKIRALMKSDINFWENTFFQSIDNYKDEFGDDASIAGLAIIQVDEVNRKRIYERLFKDFIEKRKALEAKNRTFVNLHKCYASNQIRK